VARAQLAKLPGIVESRRRTAAELIEALRTMGRRDGATMWPARPDGSEVEIVLPRPDGHAWWLFPLVLPGGDAPELAAHLSAAGIPARPGYLKEPLNQAPLWERPVYGASRFPLEGYRPASCPEAERLVGSTLLIIDWNEHYTSEHVKVIADAIANYRARA
jgi:dTDP-4-amino-4,6-dideoxygalactose transaminase